MAILLSLRSILCAVVRCFQAEDPRAAFRDSRTPPARQAMEEQAIEVANGESDSDTDPPETYAQDARDRLEQGDLDFEDRCARDRAPPAPPRWGMPARAAAARRRRRRRD